VFVYCGHSSGEQYLPSDELKRIKVKSTALLMGCSSGMLKYEGDFDCTGTVMSYCIAGR